MAFYRKRKREEWEERFIGDYLALKFPDRPYKTKVRLGPISTALPLEVMDLADLALIGVTRRRCDAIVYLPDRVLIIEAAIRQIPGKLSQLELYLSLYPDTPEEQEYRDWPLAGRLVFAISDPAAIALAKAHNVEVDYFRPAYIDTYLATLQRRETRAPRV